MRLSRYNNYLSQACFKALYQGMCYLNHHLMVPMMYLSKKISDEKSVRSHCAKGEAKITSYSYTAHSRLEAWSDMDFGRDILIHRSTTSV